MEHDDAAPNEGAVQETDDHVDGGTATGDDEVGIERHHRRKGTIDAEQGEQVGRSVPFLTHQQNDEIFGNKCEAQEAGKADEAGEAQHLAESRYKPRLSCCRIPQYGLCHALNHTADGGDGSVVPLAGIVVDTCDVTTREETVEEDTEGVVVELEGETVDEKLRRKAEHSPSWLEKSEK